MIRIILALREHTVEWKRQRQMSEGNCPMKTPLSHPLLVLLLVFEAQSYGLQESRSQKTWF
jgi:hypothetical protein